MRVTNQTKGQKEAQISKRITQFEKTYLGRGPTEVRTYIIHDMILIRLKGMLTPAEAALVTDIEGIQLLKQVRREMIENLKPVLEELIKEETGIKITTLHTDLSVVSGEKIILFGLEKNLEKCF